MISLQELAINAEVNGTQIASGKFETIADFFVYFDLHYKPILLDMAKESAKYEGAKKFLASDLLDVLSCPDWWETSH